MDMYVSNMKQPRPFKSISPPSTIQAEKIAARMISEDRMEGSIDQIASVVYFKRKYTVYIIHQI